MDFQHCHAAESLHSEWAGTINIQGKSDVQLVAPRCARDALGKLNVIAGNNHLVNAFLTRNPPQHGRPEAVPKPVLGQETFQAEIRARLATNSLGHFLSKS